MSEQLAMQVSPYLSFNGHCATAFKFYEQCLGGKILFMQSHGESPMADQVPPAWRDRIMHATLKVGDNVLMGTDAPPEHYQKPQGLYVSLSVTAPADAERVFNALAESGTVQLPIQKTFWSVRFGMVTDRFGIPWMVNCSQAA
jgi:PhnB protein